MPEYGSFIVQIRQYFRVVGKYRNGMLFMAGSKTVFRADSPAGFIGKNIRRPQIYHRLNRKYHSRLNARVRSASGTIRNARVFMHFKSDTVPAIIVNYAVIVLYRDIVNRIGNIADSVSGTAGFNTGSKAFKRNFIKFSPFRLYVAD